MKEEAIRTVAELKKGHLPNFPELWTTQYEHIREKEMPRMSAEVLLYLQYIRTVIGVPMMITSDPGGWVRFDSSSHSQHAVDPENPEKLSLAIDIFPKAGECCRAFDYLRASKRVGAVGIYIGVKPRPMIHMDLRKRDDTQIVWACRQSKTTDGEKFKVYNYMTHPEQYHRFMGIYNEVLTFDVETLRKARA